MSDLVTRLRRGWLKPLHTPTEFAEAADMIEQLQAENARYRAALERIAKVMMWEATSIAREALGETHE